MLRYFIRLLGALSVAIFVLHSAAFACFVPPPHMYLSHDEAIEDAEWIVVAEAVRRTSKDVEFSNNYTFSRPAYEMRVLEYIKGSGPDTITIANRDERAARGHSKETVERNFYGHAASKFWTNGGSYFNWPDCQIHPGFLFAGHRYLIFGPKDYQNGFENVALDGDLWLDYVRKYVSGQKVEKPFPISPEDYFKRAEAIVRVRAEWDGSTSSWSTEVLKGRSDLRYMYLAYVSPEAEFNQHLNPDCREVFSDKLVNLETRFIDRLYVFEQLPTKDINHVQSFDCVGPDLSTWGTAEARGKYSQTGYRVFNIVDDNVFVPPSSWHISTTILDLEAEESFPLQIVLDIVK